MTCVGVKLTLTVRAVIDPVRKSAEHWRCEWYPMVSFSSITGADRGISDWMLRSLFDRSCNITTLSVVRVLL